MKESQYKVVLLWNETMIPALCVYIYMCIYTFVPRAVKYSDPLERQRNWLGVCERGFVHMTAISSASREKPRSFQFLFQQSINMIFQQCSSKLMKNKKKWCIEDIVLHCCCRSFHTSVVNCDLFLTVALPKKINKKKCELQTVLRKTMPSLPND